MRSLSDLTLTQKLSLLVLFFGALTSAASFYLGGSQWAYYFLIASTTAIIATDRVARYEFERKVDKQLTLYSYSPGDLHLIGSGAEAIDWFCNNTKNLQIAKNTMFSRSDRDKFPLAALKVKQLEDTIRELLSSNCRWMDVFTTNQTEAAESFRKSLSTDQRKNYASKRLQLERPFPLLQSVLLTYKDGSKSVLFGWGFFGGNEHDSLVFQCSEKNTVRYFSRYFEELEENATLVSEGQSFPTSPHS